MHRSGLLVTWLIICSLLLLGAESMPQIHSYDVAEVNAKVFDEQDEVETSEHGKELTGVKTAIMKTEGNDLLALIQLSGRKASQPGTKYVEIQESVVEDGASPTVEAGSIALEVLDEVGDALGSRGAVVRRMEALLKDANKTQGR